MNTTVPFTSSQALASSPRSRADRAIAACREHFLDNDWRFSQTSREMIVDVMRRQSGVRHFAYLGCPTLAIAHTAANSQDKDRILLIDKGHPGIWSWIAGGLFDVRHYLPLDLLDTNALRGLPLFDAVIADPPWYEQEYGAFITAARQLVRPGGIVGVTMFPAVSPYKNDKRAYFRQLVGTTLGVSTDDASYLGHLDVSYTCPSFESSWSGERQFIDPQSRRYRPATMEFYRIHSDSAVPIPTTITPPPSKPLPRVIRTGDGHYLRTVAELPSFPIRVNAETHRRFSHVHELSSDIVAWSTGNTVVRVAETGAMVSNYDQIVHLIAAYERRSASEE